MRQHRRHAQASNLGQHRAQQVGIVGRYGYKQTSRGLGQRVRFTPKSGHSTACWPTPFCAAATHNQNL